MKRLMLVAVACLCVVVPAHASPLIVAQPGSYLTTFANPVVTYARGQGQTLTLVHADVQPHNVVARGAVRPDGSASWCGYYASGRCPLFWTPLIGLGQSALVEGLEDAASGRVYDFFCSYHPSMTGILVVV